MSTPSSDTPPGPPPTYEEAVKGSVSLSFNSSKEVEQNHLLIFSDKEQYEFKIEDLEEEERIGGRVDTINRYRHVLSGKKLAIKLMNLHISRYYQTDESDKIRDLKKETEKFRKLSNHPNVLQFYGIFIHERNILLCMELMDLSLDFIIEFFNKKTQIFPEELLGIIVVAVVNALGDCQAQAIKHSYIKPQHILLNYNGDIKLGDFGETRIMHNDLASTVENKSLYYWPPERFELDYQLDYLSSVWSLGITILEAVCGKLPFENIEMRLKAVQEQICNFDANGVIRRVFHTEKEPYYSQEIRQFVKSCLKRQSERSNYQNLKETTFYVKYKEIYNNELVSKCLRNLEEKEIQSQQPIDTSNIIESFDNDNTNKLIFPHTPKVEYMFDINHFVKTNFLQEGCVYSYFHQPSQRAIAVKLLHLPASKSDNKDAEKVEKLKNELENFRLVSYYPTIVDFYGLSIYRSQIWICMELMDVSLHTFYHWYKVQELDTPEWLIGIVTVSMVDALNFCQSKKILHRDIKPRNILLNKNGDVKLCDFGESIATNISSGTRLVGTVSYMAPEMIKTPGIEQDAKTDVWSLGITLLEIAYKQLPYGKSDNIVAIQHLIINMDVDKIIQKCFVKKSSPRTYYSPDLGEFIRTCLKEYDYRPHFKTLRKEPFYQSNKNEENRYRKKLAMKVKKMLTSSGINAEEKATIQNLDTSDKNLINGLNKEEKDRFEKILADIELSLKHLTTLTLPEKYNIEINCDYLFSTFFNLATMDLDLNEDCCAQIRKKCDSIVVKEQILESYIKSFEDFVETRNGDGTDIESYDVCRIRSGIKIFIDILYEKSANYRFLQNFMQKDGPIEQLNEQIKQWHKYFYCIDRNDRPKSFEKRRADHWWWFC